MTIPSIIKAKGKALRYGCMNNLSMIGKELEMFRQDYSICQPQFGYGQEIMPEGDHH